MVSCGEAVAREFYLWKAKELYVLQRVNMFIDGYEMFCFLQVCH